MRIAITGDGALAAALTARLAAQHEVRHPAVDVLDPEAVAGLCAGVDRVVHLARAAPSVTPGPAVGPAPRPSWPAAISALDLARAARGDGEGEAQAATRILDTALKGTWNAMQAARQAGAAQVVQVSDLSIYSGYGDDLLLSEDMVALPDTSALQQAVHLAEGIGHEFAREQPGFVLTLRLGTLVDAAALPAGAPFDRDWLDLTDAVAAVERGLALDRYDHPEHWGLYNLVADTPFSRFALRKVKGGRFAFAPRVDFRARWPGAGAGR